MTTAKTHHRIARALLLRHLDMHPGRVVDADLDPAEVGIVGDTPHVLGGDSYHLGADQIRARNGDDRYSVDESARDKRGLDEHASAIDVGWFKVTTRRGTFTLRDFSVWLVNLCKAGDPDTLDLREVIYSPDGKTVKRWDREGRRSSGDRSHLVHTHLTEYRDASGIRMVRLVTRFLQHIGMIPEEDTFMAELSETQQKNLARRVDRTWLMVRNLESLILALTKGQPARPRWKDTETGYTYPVVPIVGNVLLRELASRAGVTAADLDAALDDLPTADENAQAVLEAIGTSSPQDTAAALRVVLGDQAAEVGRLLAGAPTS